MSGNPTKGCDNRIDTDFDLGRNIKIVPSANRDQISEKQGNGIYLITDTGEEYLSGGLDAQDLEPDR